MDSEAAPTLRAHPRSGSTLSFGRDLRRRLANNLEAFSRREVGEEMNQAAVALALVPGGDGEATLILTQRAFHLPRHGGQYALPGGRIDAGESVVEAARRELREEVGVEISRGGLVGTLDDYSTRSGWRVTPVVLWADDQPVELQPDPQEVERAFQVPLAELVRPEVKVERTLPGYDSPLLSLRLLGTEIFCPTAAMVYQLLEVGLRGKATRVNSFAQPRFAWR